MSVKEVTFRFEDWESCVAARLTKIKVPEKDGTPVMTDDEWTIEGMRDRLQRDYEKGKTQVEIDKLAINDNMVTVKEKENEAGTN